MIVTEFGVVHSGSNLSPLPSVSIPSTADEGAYR